MADKTRHPVQAWIMSNPCFYLFAALLLLFLFGHLTTAGGGDLLPRGKATQMLVLLEEVAGTLSMGGVARLVSMYSNGHR